MSLRNPPKVEEDSSHVEAAAFPIAADPPALAEAPPREVGDTSGLTDLCELAARTTIEKAPDPEAEAGTG